MMPYHTVPPTLRVPCRLEGNALDGYKVLALYPDAHLINYSSSPFELRDYLRRSWDEGLYLTFSLADHETWQIFRNLGVQNQLREMLNNEFDSDKMINKFPYACCIPTQTPGLQRPIINQILGDLEVNRRMTPGAVLA